MAQGFRHAITAIILGLALGIGTPASAGVSVLGAPKWRELTPSQQEVLAPLSKEWDGMEVYRRQKWLGIAKRYPSLAPDEQARIRQRMADWAKLTPEERTKAREKFKKLQKASPDQKDALKEKWQEYEKLPPEEKKRLADSAKARAALQKQPSAKPKLRLAKPTPPMVPASASSAAASMAASPETPLPAASSDASAGQPSY